MTDDMKASPAQGFSLVTQLAVSRVKLEESLPSCVYDVIGTVTRLMMSTDFTLQYLGSVEDLTLSPTSDVVDRSAEAQLIDKLEDAQLEGKLPYTASENAKGVLLNVSKHGIKVMDVAKKDVFQRHPLHVIAQAIHYADGLGKFNLVIKTGQPGKNTFSCYIFQSSAEDQIVGVSKNLQQIFNQITQTQR